MCRQCRVDLTELDTEPTDLHLEVVAAHVLNLVSVSPTHNITGAVHALTGQAVRVGNKAIRAQSRAAMVSAGDLGTRQVQLTGNANRNGLQTCVENKRGHVADGFADGHPVARHQRHTDIGDDSGLGGTVDIEERTSTVRLISPLGHQLRRVRLTADTNHLEIVQARRIHGSQRRGRDEGMCDAFGLEQRGQFVAAEDRCRDDHHGSACRDS